MPTTATSAPTVQVVVYGPNLLDLTDGPDFHVHRLGCADCDRYENAGHDAWPLTVTGFMDVVLATYPPSDFQYDPDNSEDAEPYKQSFQVFPCVVWPQPRPQDKEIEEARERADKAEAEYTAILDEVSDEKMTDPHFVRRWDRAYAAALATAMHLSKLLNPATTNGSLSAPRRRSATAKPLRPDAAPKDGVIVCVGLPNYPEYPGCGQEKPSDKFPTTGVKDENGVITRAPECRDCRAKRRAAIKAAKAS